MMKMKMAPLARPALPALLFALVLAGCAGSGSSGLQPQIAASAEVLQPGDAGYERAVIGSAVKAAGQGGVSEGMVIRIVQDIPVWRMWNGPAKLDARGNTNRMGGWWSYDPPKGTVQQYRAAYEICNGWNDLTWVAKCTLKAGSIVVVGPGQSVSAQTCGDPTGLENYAANPVDWQLYIDKPWARSAELVCPDASADYEADPADISRPRKSGS